MTPATVYWMEDEVDPPNGFGLSRRALVPGERIAEDHPGDPKNGIRRMELTLRRTKCGVRVLTEGFRQRDHQPPPLWDMRIEQREGASRFVISKGIDEGVRCSNRFRWHLPWR